MFGICLESSHQKGMGHLFRMINFAKCLDKELENFIFIINNNKKTKDILNSKGYKFEVVDLVDHKSDWESSIIRKYGLKYWINDRLDTSKDHSQNILKNTGVMLVSFDDYCGSLYSDIGIYGLFSDDKILYGKKVLKGSDYLILNSDIDIYKKHRFELKKILVSMGGSDTYGVTLDVVKMLLKYNIKATIHTGPSFMHRNELETMLAGKDGYQIVNSVDSLVSFFSEFDIAITGGGITPFEANASGLPCIIIANEEFEIPNALYLNSLLSSIFIGFRKDVNFEIFSNLSLLDLKKMSQNGMRHLNTSAAKKIYIEVKEFEKNNCHSSA